MHYEWMYCRCMSAHIYSMDLFTCSSLFLYIHHPMYRSLSVVTEIISTYSNGTLEQTSLGISPYAVVSSPYMGDAIMPTAGKDRLKQSGSAKSIWKGGGRPERSKHGRFSPQLEPTCLERFTVFDLWELYSRNRSTWRSGVFRKASESHTCEIIILDFPADKKTWMWSLTSYVVDGPLQTCILAGFVLFVISKVAKYRSGLQVCMF